MKPNIIVFMTDHQRGDTLFKDSPVKTPNADKFREKSVVFENAYCPAPHCCPARATFWSGLYPSQHGVWNNVGVSNALSKDIFDDVTIFSEDLKQAGYNLYYSGKWHVSASQSPDQFGFELLYHNLAGYNKYPNIPDVREWDLYTKRGDTVDKGDEPRTQGRIVREGYEEYIQYGINESPYKDQEVTTAAIDKLDDIDPTTPFFMYVGTVGPHDPYCVPQRFLDMYDINDIQLPDSFEDDMTDKPALYQRTKSRYEQLSPEEHRESIRRFYAFCTYEDYLFGQLVAKVEEKNLMENTMILYASDHGDYVGAHGLWAKGLPCFKEAYHICSMVGGGPIKNGGRCEKALLSLADWAPTFLELAGISTDRHFAGTSVMPFLHDQQPTQWRSECYSQTNGNEVYGIQRGVWNTEYKYVFNAFDFDELYNLVDDPNEMHNLLHGIKDVTKSIYKDIVREMCMKMWEFAYKNKDNCVNSYIMTAFAPYGPGIIFNKE